VAIRATGGAMDDDGIAQHVASRFSVSQCTGRVMLGRIV
jgi:hypothetical protein